MLDDMAGSPRGVFKLVLADTLARRGSLTPLSPLWKAGRIRMRAALRRILHARAASTGRTRHE